MNFILSLKRVIMIPQCVCVRSDPTPLHTLFGKKIKL